MCLFKARGDSKIHITIRPFLSLLFKVLFLHNFIIVVDNFSHTHVVWSWLELILFNYVISKISKVRGVEII